jgi:hypothetical protein
MKPVIDMYYLQRAKMRTGETVYFQAIYSNGINTKMLAYKVGESIKTTIYAEDWLEIGDAI